MSSTLFLPMVVAFLVTLGSVWLIKPLALRLGLVDAPGGRKLHAGTVPLIGGIAMFLGFCFGLLTLNISLSAYRSLIACSALLMITGLLDDFHELTPRSRLFIQFLVGILIIAWGNVGLYTLGNLFGLGHISLGYFAFPVTIIAVVAVINAVNMSDGIDGLASSLALVEFFYLAFIAQRAHLSAETQLITLVIAVLFAFLYFNFPWRQNASVFMGDSGSMFLGLMLVWFCIALSQSPENAARPVTFLWIMAVPLWDISYVVFRRLWRGFSPFRADRSHLHYFLLHCGFSPLKITGLISMVAVACGFIGLLGEYFYIPESLMFGGFILSFIVYLLLLQKGWKRQTLR